MTEKADDSRKFTNLVSGFLATGVFEDGKFRQPPVIHASLFQKRYNLQLKMFNLDLISDRVARANLDKRRQKESARQERIFNDKVRLIGVSWLE